METNNNLDANLTDQTPEKADTTANTTGASTIVPQETQRINVLSDLLKEQADQSKSINSAKIESELNFESQVKAAADQQEPQNVEEKVSENNTENTTQNNTRGRDCRLEKLLLARINAMQGKIKESLELIKKFEKINAKEEHLPNIVTTLRDKLTQEVIVQCRTVGIEFNMNSYLVQSIVSDLLSIFEEGITEFKECSENLTFVKEVQDDIESRVELAPTNRVRNLISRLRGLFKPENKQKLIEDKERERQENKLEQANIHLIKYKYLNNELSKYTIRKNIVDSLTKEMLYGKDKSDATIKEFIADKIAPEMKQLGLQYLMPVLNEKISTECTEKIGTIESDKLQQISISDIKNSIKAGEYIITEHKEEVDKVEAVEEIKESEEIEKVESVEEVKTEEVKEETTTIEVSENSEENASAEIEVTTNEKPEPVAEEEKKNLQEVREKIEQIVNKKEENVEDEMVV